MGYTIFRVRAKTTKISKKKLDIYKKQQVAQIDHSEGTSTGRRREGKGRLTRGSEGGRKRKRHLQIFKGFEFKYKV